MEDYSQQDRQTEAQINEEIHTYANNMCTKLFASTNVHCPSKLFLLKTRTITSNSSKEHQFHFDFTFIIRFVIHAKKIITIPSDTERFSWGVIGDTYISSNIF